MLSKRMTIRQSIASDGAAIVTVQSEAFGRTDEADLSMRLISAPPNTISLIAESNGEVVGHVLLTEIGAPVRAMALAPLAVVPQFREMQVGSQLVRAAIDQAREAGYEAIFVLGDNAYYERFGFVSNKADPFDVKWQGPHFMALELREGALGGKAGKLQYPEAFFAL
ncbi:MAG: N-acetyltransferase [Nitratireductor sp.]|nr:N-acetyltransferase [Nitratireductor sp.]MCB1458704.1 N-acetyltransferase [Nitratireductor sp.]